jgi:hypothetical protein
MQRNERRLITRIPMPILNSMGICSAEPIAISQDNQASIKLATNSGSSKLTKHIDVRYHFTRELIERKLIAVHYVPTSRQTADFLTKAVGPQILRRCIQEIGMMNNKADDDNNKKTRVVTPEKRVTHDR